MLTFFTTAKPFQGHNGIIQRNALKSWKLLHPDVEVIVFGEDEGAAEVCAELGLVHHPRVERHESGRNRLDYMFQRARQIARHEHLCYCNCDIVLLQDFWTGFQKARAWREQFLLVARRWDTDITEPIPFEERGWMESVRRLALTKGFQRNEFWIDVFLFRRGMYLDMPALIVGHCYWDNWMIWKALSERVPVLDGTAFVMPVHQNHGYNPAFGRAKDESTDALSLVNLQLAGGPKRLRHINSSTHYMTPTGDVRLRLFRRKGPVPKPLRELHRFWTYDVRLPIWHFALDITRPLRSVLGLRSKKPV